jgi:hypothetical protein
MMTMKMMMMNLINLQLLMFRDQIFLRDEVLTTHASDVSRLVIGPGIAVSRGTILRTNATNAADTVTGLTFAG